MYQQYTCTYQQPPQHYSSSAHCNIHVMLIISVNIKLSLKCLPNFPAIVSRTMFMFKSKQFRHMYCCIFIWTSSNKGVVGTGHKCVLEAQLLNHAAACPHEIGHKTEIHSYDIIPCVHCTHNYRLCMKVSYYKSLL